MAALLIDTEGDVQLMRERYGERLDRRIAALGVRPGWQDLGQPPETLQENIRSRIICRPKARDRFADNGVCTFDIECEKIIERTRSFVGEISVDVSHLGPTVLCTIDPDVAVLDERQQEDDAAVRILVRWHEMPSSVATVARLPAEPFIGVFDFTPRFFIGLYGVDGGQRLRFSSVIVVPTDPPPHQIVVHDKVEVGTGWSFHSVIHGGLTTLLARRPDGE